jgi:hypothetical protein
VRGERAQYLARCSVIKQTGHRSSFPIFSMLYHVLPQLSVLYLFLDFPESSRTSVDWERTGRHGRKGGCNWDGKLDKPDGIDNPLKLGARHRSQAKKEGARDCGEERERVGVKQGIADLVRGEKISKVNNQMLLVEQDRSSSKWRRTYTMLKGYEVVSEKADLKDTRETGFWKHQGPIWKRTILQIHFE